jgi:hypothetical protein
MASTYSGVSGGDVTSDTHKNSSPTLTPLIDQIQITNICEVYLPLVMRDAP